MGAAQVKPNPIRWFVIGVLSAVIVLILNRHIPYDDTDNAATAQRSGLQHYVDHGTGCEYIARPYFGELYPRLDANGQHICGRR